MKNVKLFFVLAAFSLLAPTGYISAQSPVKGPRVSLVNNNGNYDFGAVIVNSSTTHQFEFTNSGTEPLVITNMRSKPIGNNPPGNLLVSWSKKTVLPGKKGVITVTYVSAGDIGSFKEDVYVTSDATGAEYSILHISGAVTPLTYGSADPDKDPPQGQILIYKGPIWKR